MLEAELSLQTFLMKWAIQDSKNKDTFERKNLERDHGMEFCEKFTEINAELHKNALYFGDDFIQKIIDAYHPFFQLILSIDRENPPEFPDSFHDAITTGKTPRISVINIFRNALGVANSPSVEIKKSTPV